MFVYFSISPGFYWIDPLGKGGKECFLIVKSLNEGECDNPSSLYLDESILFSMSLVYF